MWPCVVALVSGAVAADAAEPRSVDPDEMAKVVRALSSRDPVSCSTIEALAADPVPVLLAVVEQVSMPPYAPMRAATCLIDAHAAKIQPQLEQWVVQPELKGLGRLVLGSLDRMPAEVSVPVVRRALAEGSDPALAAERAAAASTPEIRALVTR